MGDSSLSGKLIHLALDIFGYGTYIAIMHILEAVSIGDFFLTEEELITSRYVEW